MIATVYMLAMLACWFRIEHDFTVNPSSAKLREEGERRGLWDSTKILLTLFWPVYFAASLYDLYNYLCKRRK